MISEVVLTSGVEYFAPRGLLVAREDRLVLPAREGGVQSGQDPGCHLGGPPAHSPNLHHKMYVLAGPTLGTSYSVARATQPLEELLCMKL